MDTVTTFKLLLHLVTPRPNYLRTTYHSAIIKPIHHENKQSKTYITAQPVQAGNKQQRCPKDARETTQLIIFTTRLRGTVRCDRLLLSHATTVQIDFIILDSHENTNPLTSNKIVKSPLAKAESFSLR